MPMFSVFCHLSHHRTGFWPFLFHQVSPSQLWFASISLSISVICNIFLVASSLSRLCTCPIQTIGYMGASFQISTFLTRSSLSFLFPACTFQLYAIMAIIRQILQKVCRNIICDPSGRNQSHVGRVRFPLRAEMHGRAHITDSCFIAFITSKIC